MSGQAVLAAYLHEPSRQHRDKLFATYWYLCLRGAKRFVRAGVERADLIQVGAVGLLKAVDGYDARLETPFEAYAWLLVVGELMHYVRDHERVVRIPRKLRALERRYARETERLVAQLGRTPSTAEIAAELCVGVSIIDEIRLLRRGGAVISLEACTGSPTGELAARRVDLGMTERLALSHAIEQLAQPERVAILASFATGLSQAQIGRHLGVSQSQVSKLIKKALCKMQRQVA